MLSHLRDEMMGLWVPIATKLIAGLIGPGAVNSISTITMAAKGNVFVSGS